MNGYRRLCQFQTGLPAQSAAINRIALRTVDFPEPFGPNNSVNGAKVSFVFRSDLKFVNSIDSIISITLRSSLDAPFRCDSSC